MNIHPQVGETGQENSIRFRVLQAGRSRTWRGGEEWAIQSGTADDRISPNSLRRDCSIEFARLVRASGIGELQYTVHARD